MVRASEPGLRAKRRSKKQMYRGCMMSQSLFLQAVRRSGFRERQLKNFSRLCAILFETGPPSSRLACCRHTRSRRCLLEVCPCALGAEWRIKGWHVGLSSELLAKHMCVKDSYSNVSQNVQYRSHLQLATADRHEGECQEQT